MLNPENITSNFSHNDGSVVREPVLSERLQDVAAAFFALGAIDEIAFDARGGMVYGIACFSITSVAAIVARHRENGHYKALGVDHPAIASPRKVTPKV